MITEYQGGTQELRDEMADALRDWDWSGWEVTHPADETWMLMSVVYAGLIDNGSYKFRRKPRALTYNGVDVPTPICDDMLCHSRLRLTFKNGRQRDQFQAAIRKAMDGDD